MNLTSKLTQISTTVMAEAKPLPSDVQDGLDTVLSWVKIIGGSLAVLGLMILFIGLFFANQTGRGQDFMGKVGWWLTGAIGLGLAAVLAGVFIGA